MSAWLRCFYFYLFDGGVSVKMGFGATRGGVFGAISGCRRMKFCLDGWK